MLPRPGLEQRIRTALGRARAVVLVGPRQCGKSTLARRFLSVDDPNYFDLENPASRSSLAQPMVALQALQGLVVIDEVQHAPELFRVLRVLIDRHDRPGQYLLLGSASPTLLRQTSETLLGRVEVIEIAGFDLQEVGVGDTTRLWLRGGFPPAYTAANDADASAWCSNAVERFVQSDLPQFGVNVAAPAMMRFWAMLAHLHGQVWNAADPARSLGVSEPTVRRYLDWLTQGFMVRQLQPWYENLGKRQVKSPKIYFRDTGYLHALLGIRGAAELTRHPRAGASWEGFALEQVLRLAQPDEAYFWATHQGAELDLLMFKHGKRVGIEFKRVDAPSLTPSMRIAMRDLGLHALYVVYPGDRRYRLAEGVEAVPMTQFVAAP
ncbi:MAG: ATP-binding protein [Ideonella sp.]|nr:ATP-binding protein [Ideonella sp.]MCC7456751.1 ATP-binding protein [Nitrospira sp.]